MTGVDELLDQITQRTNKTTVVGQVHHLKNTIQIAAGVLFVIVKEVFNDMNVNFYLVPRACARKFQDKRKVES